ncbi:MAG: type II toxin-antitoxin system RelE/ParE family toxin [Proteobacteria bacterium]|nr:type II toxin-antitoxin system RelE/ParE family toxin [Pseudomonadota bacterium]
MTKRFRDKRTETIFNDELVKGIHPHLLHAARIRLQYVHAAASLDDLRLPPSNRLERLKGKRAGQWSIRVNKQWRICFAWENGKAVEIEFVDYH